MVEIVPSGAGSEIRVQSKCRAQLISWGKNTENVSLLLQSIQQNCQNNELARSEVNSGVYKIQPAVALAKGEYGLYLSRGEGMAPYIYDFSVQ